MARKASPHRNWKLGTDVRHVNKKLLPCPVRFEQKRQRTAERKSVAKPLDCGCPLPLFLAAHLLYWRDSAKADLRWLPKNTEQCFTRWRAILLTLIRANKKAAGRDPAALRNRILWQRITFESAISQ